MHPFLGMYDGRGDIAFLLTTDTGDAGTSPHVARRFFQWYSITNIAIYIINNELRYHCSINYIIRLQYYLYLGMADLTIWHSWIALNNVLFFRRSVWWFFSGWSTLYDFGQLAAGPSTWVSSAEWNSLGNPSVLSVSIFVKQGDRLLSGSTTQKLWYFIFFYLIYLKHIAGFRTF